MLEKDYFMKLIQLLIEALQKIKNNIDNNEIEKAENQIRKSYDFLGRDNKYFKKAETNEIINFFKTQNGEHLKRVMLLADLFFLESKIQTNIKLKNNFLKKSQSLFNYYSSNSKEYSFELQAKLSQIKIILKKHEK